MQSLRLLPYSTRERPFIEKLGALVGDDKVLDLQVALSFYLQGKGMSHNPLEELGSLRMTELLSLGEEVMNLVRASVAYAEREVLVSGNSREGMRSIGEITVLPPVRRPGKILCLGLNFSSHAREQNKTVPNKPMAFLKSSTSVIGPYDPIPRPRFTNKLDYEIEFAAIIGKKGKEIPEARAAEHIVGYSIFNDLSARDLQFPQEGGMDILLGKSFDCGAPFGPYLVLKDQVPSPYDLRMETKVNGELRQSGSTKEMAFTFEKALAYFSQYMSFEPGDVITSSTPGGVAVFHKPDPSPWFLKPGDVLEMTIEGIGTIRNTVIA